MHYEVHIKLIMFCLTLCMASSCYQEESILNSMQKDFDISIDDNKIAYSFCDTHGCSIFEFAFKDSTNKRITPVEKNEDNFYPRYSPDGNKIIFLTKLKSKGNLPRISIYNKFNGAISQISTDSLHVTEAAFSADGAGIYFIAVILKKYGSLKSSPSYGYDIFYTDTNGSNIRKVTELAAMSISGIALSSGGKSLISHIESFDKQYYGLYQIDLLAKQNPIQIRAKFMQGADVGYNFTFSPAASADGLKIFAVSARVIICIDRETNTATSLYSTNDSFIYSPRLFHTSNKLAFTQDVMKDIPNQRPRAICEKLYVMDLLAKSTSSYLMKDTTTK